jgi:hypothetical protein
MINADRYTKFVLTVIACTLLIFVFINFQAAFGQSSRRVGMQYWAQCNWIGMNYSGHWECGGRDMRYSSDKLT